MATEHFCLRWNNHQSTLVSVFDNLLESGTLVDCTLAADGRYLKAHKVVLSACSPYLGVLLSQHHDKHPIIILKDVKFEELKAMLDYMYRGEVNISQEQLTTFLKAAESLQIKGLTDTGGEEGLQPIRPPSSNSTVSANNDEPPSPADGGSPSRKRKRNRTLDEMPDCETKLTISDSGSEKGRDVSVSSVGANVTKTSVGVKREVMDGEGDGQMSVDDSGDSALMSRPGPSNGGSTNNKGSPWLASDNSEDMQMTPSQGGVSASELQNAADWLVPFIQMASPLSAHLTPDKSLQEKKYSCQSCGKSYQLASSLYTHEKYQCGKEPAFQCPYCPHKTKLKGNLKAHIGFKHADMPRPF